MLRWSSTEWPIGYADPWQAPRPQGGVAPLRHDLALARYLEKQAACRASTVRQFDAWATAIRLCVRMAYAGLAALRGLRSLPQEQPTKWAG
jgi:hypothetical protein